ILNTNYDVGDTSFFVKGAGTLLFVLFVILLFRYSTARDFSTLAAILILFIANNFFDYTAQTWMMTSVIPFAIVGRLRGGIRAFTPLLNLLTLLAVVFFGYRSILYAIYVPWMRQVLIGSAI